MDFSKNLGQISSYIYNQSADLDQQISRLEQVKFEIKNEQNGAFEQWNRMLKPDLVPYWQGERAVSFQENRDHAFQEMLKIFQHEYDEYIRQIQSKIDHLREEKVVLSFASNLANEAEQLLKKGEEGTQALQGKINEIRRRLF